MAYYRCSPDCGVLYKCHPKRTFQLLPRLASHRRDEKAGAVYHILSYKAWRSYTSRCQFIMIQIPNTRIVQLDSVASFHVSCNFSFESWLSYEIRSQFKAPSTVARSFQTRSFTPPLFVGDSKHTIKLFVTVLQLAFEKLVLNSSSRRKAICPAPSKTPTRWQRPTHLWRWVKILRIASEIWNAPSRTSKPKFLPICRAHPPSTCTVFIELSSKVEEDPRITKPVSSVSHKPQSQDCT